MVGFFFSTDFRYLNFKILKQKDKKFRKKNNPGKGLGFFVCLCLGFFKDRLQDCTSGNFTSKAEYTKPTLLKVNKQPMENWMWPQWLQLN